jgi:hypothetical protein
MGPLTPLQVRIESLPPMRVARFHALGPDPETKAWSNVRTWAEARGLWSAAAMPPVFGFNNPPPLRGHDGYGYEIWICLDPGTVVESSTDTLDFPGGWYAVTSCPGLPSPDLWMRLLGWVRQSEFRRRPTHELERPLNPWAPPAEMRFDLYLPIVEPRAVIA